MTPSRRAVLALVAAGCCAGSTGRSVAAGGPLRLRRGVNAWPWFSLTREYPAPRTDYGWPAFQEGRPVPDARDLFSLAEAGFDFVRLPVDPGPFLAFSGERRNALFRDLSDAVTMILGAGLSVLVNVQANAATHHYTPAALYADGFAPLFPAYRDFVVDLARRLETLGAARIALEPVNEPPQSCGSQTWAALQADLLAAARRTAPTLTLVACGACGSMVPGLAALDPAPLARFAPLLFTAHFYEPYLFSHQGAPWMREPVYRALNAVPWPASAGSFETTLAAVRTRMAADTASTAKAKDEAYAITKAKLSEYFAAQPDRRYLAHHLAGLSDWAARHAVPVRDIVIGEFGALRTESRYVAAADPDRARYVRDVRETAEAAGFGWAFWNLFDGMGLMDETSRRLDPEIIAALGLRSPDQAR